MSTLALLGGTPLRREPWPRYVTIGEAEKQAVLRVLDGGVLSDFYGSRGEKFRGGPTVRAFEEEWAASCRSPFAVAVNSATSGLYAAVGAVGIGPGDEVITTPYSMSATATGIVVYGGVPVFADIEPDTFTLDPRSVEQRITRRTRAIIVTHLFGHPADMDGILDVARRHGLKVIEDAAQSPGIVYRGRPVGTIGDIGVFSLNCHKTIQTGEGGVCTTRDAELAKRLQLIRNHAEAVLGDGMDVENPANMVGWNYRMTELEAAIGREQLKRLRGFNERRTALASRLSDRLRRLPGVVPPVVRAGCTHGYYVYPVVLDPAVLGISRNLFAEALTAEGVPATRGYLRPLYLLPLYQRRIGFGRDGYPFSWPGYDGKPDYSLGLCPVTEEIERRITLLDYVRDPLGPADIDTIADAFEKVVNGVEALERHQERGGA